MATKLYLSAEQESREDELEHHLQIARDRNLGIEIQEFYLPELMWGNWKPRLEQYKQLLDGFDSGLSIHNAFYGIDHAGLDTVRSTLSSFLSVWKNGRLPRSSLPKSTGRDL